MWCGSVAVECGTGSGRRVEREPLPASCVSGKASRSRGHEPYATPARQSSLMARSRPAVQLWTLTFSHRAPNRNAAHHRTRAEHNISFIEGNITKNSARCIESNRISVSRIILLSQFVASYRRCKIFEALTRVQVKIITPTIHLCRHIKNEKNEKRSENWSEQVEELKNYETISFVATLCDTYLVYKTNIYTL